MAIILCGRCPLYALVLFISKEKVRNPRRKHSKKQSNNSSLRFRCTTQDGELQPRNVPLFGFIRHAFLRVQRYVYKDTKKN
jgi:hypothetical protein